MRGFRKPGGHRGWRDSGGGGGGGGGGGAFGPTPPGVQLASIAGTATTYARADHSHGDQVFNVLNYGALGNGVQDDGPAINAAVLAAKLAGGGVVRLPGAGFSYRVATEPDLTGCNGVHVVGDGEDTIVFMDDSGGVLTLGFNYDHTYQCSLQELTISSLVQRAAGCAATVTGGGGVPPAGNTATSTNFRALNVSLDNQFNGIALVDADAGANGGCWFTYVIGGLTTRPAVGGDCYRVNTPKGGSNFFQHLFVYGVVGAGAKPNSGVRVQNTGDFTLTSVSIIGVNEGLEIDVVTGGNVTAGFVTACLFDTCGDNGCLIFGEGGTIRQIVFVNAWFSGNTNNGLAIAGNLASDIEAIKVVGSQIYHNKTGVNVTIACTGVGVFESDISGQTVSGLEFTNATHFQVSHNNVGSAYGFNTPLGIYVHGGCSSYRLGGNDLSACATKLKDSSGNAEDTGVVVGLTGRLIASGGGATSSYMGGSTPSALVALAANEALQSRYVTSTRIMYRISATNLVLNGATPYTITLYKNGAATGLFITVPAAAAANSQWGASTIAGDVCLLFASNDQLDLRMDKAASADGPALCSATVEAIGGVFS